MARGTGDKAEGKWDETKGKVKEAAGKATGDRSTELEGKKDQVKGEGKQAWGDLKNAGQRARDVSGEADDAAWVEPAAALSAARRKEIVLLPPTAVTLGELDSCGHLSAALTARRRITALIPEVFMADGAVWLTVPAGTEYPL